MVPPKKHGKVSFYKKGYHNAVIVSFTETPPNITTNIHTRGNKHLLHHQLREKISPQNHIYHLVLLTKDP